MQPSLLTQSATELARLIRTGQVSSRAVVETHIAQIQRVNPKINAVVQECFDEARVEARRVDQQILDLPAKRSLIKRNAQIVPGTFSNLAPFQIVPGTFSGTFSFGTFSKMHMDQTVPRFFSPIFIALASSCASCAVWDARFMSGV